MLDAIKQLRRIASEPLALTIIVVSVALASVGFAPIAISALDDAILMLASGCLRFDKVEKALSGKVIVLVAFSTAI